MSNYQDVIKFRNLCVQTTIVKPFACQLSVTHLRQKDRCVLITFDFLFKSVPIQIAKLKYINR